MHKDFEVKCRKKKLYTFEAQFTNNYSTKWQGSIWFLLVIEFPKILITTVLLNITDTLSEVSLSSNSLSVSGPSRELMIPHCLRDFKNCLTFHSPYVFKIGDAMCSYPSLYIKFGDAVFNYPSFHLKIGDAMCSYPSLHIKVSDAMCSYPSLYIKIGDAMCSYPSLYIKIGEAMCSYPSLYIKDSHFF
jgi:hypothetical protein